MTEVRDQKSEISKSLALSALLSALCVASALLFALSFVGSLLFALCSVSEAQQPGKVYRIGYLSSGTPSPTTDPGLGAFRQRLRELGHVEGQNVVIEYRYAELNHPRLPDLAAELVLK